MGKSKEPRNRRTNDKEEDARQRPDNEKTRRNSNISKRQGGESSMGRCPARPTLTPPFDEPAKFRAPTPPGSDVTVSIVRTSSPRIQREDKYYWRSDVPRRTRAESPLANRQPAVDAQVDDDEKHWRPGREHTRGKRGKGRAENDHDSSRSDRYDVKQRKSARPRNRTHVPTAIMPSEEAVRANQRRRQRDSRDGYEVAEDQEHSLPRTRCLSKSDTLHRSSNKLDRNRDKPQDVQRSPQISVGIHEHRVRGGPDFRYRDMSSNDHIRRSTSRQPSKSGKYAEPKASRVLPQISPRRQTSEQNSPVSRSLSHSPLEMHENSVPRTPQRRDRRDNAADSCEQRYMRRNSCASGSQNTSTHPPSSFPIYHGRASVVCPIPTQTHVPVPSPSPSYLPCPPSPIPYTSTSPPVFHPRGVPPSPYLYSAPQYHIPVHPVPYMPPPIMPMVPPAGPYPPYLPFPQPEYNMGLGIPGHGGFVPPPPGPFFAPQYPPPLSPHHVQQVYHHQRRHSSSSDRHYEHQDRHCSHQETKH